MCDPSQLLGWVGVECSVRAVDCGRSFSTSCSQAAAARVSPNHVMCVTMIDVRPFPASWLGRDRRQLLDVLLPPSLTSAPPRAHVRAPHRRCATRGSLSRSRAAPPERAAAHAGGQRRKQMRNFGGARAAQPERPSAQSRCAHARSPRLSQPGRNRIADRGPADGVAGCCASSRATTPPMRAVVHWWWRRRW